MNLGFANWGDTSHILTETFLLFMVILIVHALINIYSSPLVAMLNNISVFWHVAGVAAIVLILAFVPDTAPERRTSSSPRRSTTRASAAGCSGSTCCRSASC